MKAKKVNESFEFMPKDLSSDGLKKYNEILSMNWIDIIDSVFNNKYELDEDEDEQNFTIDGPDYSDINITIENNDNEYQVSWYGQDLGHRHHHEYISDASTFDNNFSLKGYLESIYGKASDEWTNYFMSDEYNDNREDEENEDE